MTILIVNYGGSDDLLLTR